MNDDPEAARWEQAVIESELKTTIGEAKRLLPGLKIILDLAAHQATSSAHQLDLLKQFANEGSKTAECMVSVWGKHVPELIARSRYLADLVLKYETWK